IPTAIIMGKLLKGIDIREHGSKNAGGTNALRILGVKAGITTMLIDIFKGFAATFWISKLGGGEASLMMLISGIAAILGHTYTIFAGFKGGKGVGTAAGMLIAMFPLAVPICLLVFFLALIFTGYVSLGSMLAAITLPVVLSLFKFFCTIEVANALYYFSLVIPIFIIYTHRSNVQRLIKGTENRFEKAMLFRKR
ncbi:MAG TPA: glycerol-3-phosphate 1-O-acyltransferase, partial [Candidatus Marinimicrobia bacterium]|nr:glycerol-3-phosphate 1-O-acyltransferase [Candidatus Neomarinimicrobiota bacterium]